MAIRQRVWAKEQTRILRGLLGGKCEVCGTKEELEFDVKDPSKVTGPDHHKMEWSWRMSFYNRMFADDNLQLLCKEHNAEKGADDMFAGMEAAK